MKLKMRKKGDKEWEEIEHIFPYPEDEGFEFENIEWVVAWFAENRGLSDGDIVEVFRKGKYEIIIWDEPQYEAAKI